MAALLQAGPREHRSRERFSEPALLYGRVMLSMFRGRELLRIGKRLDRAVGERAEAATASTFEERADAAEAGSRRLRGLLHRPARRAADRSEQQPTE